MQESCHLENSNLRGFFISTEPDIPNLLIFSATTYPPFRSVKLRPKKIDCVVCGDNPTIKELQDYVQFCGSGALDKVSIYQPSMT